MRMREPSRGTTLIELVIVIALMSLLAAVATISLRAMAPSDQRLISDTIADTLRAVASDGRVRFVVSSGSSALVLPDGRVIADSTFGIEHLTGRPSNAK